jgi:mannose-6-phosphate isomerase-like protein (cupin superfamily)
MKTEISNKPWGSEYVLYENEDVAIWQLNIDPKNQTSLHSHPKKKTGLIVLGGAAKVSFLTGSHNLLPGEKIMIREGVFHRTTNYLSTPLVLLEIETPVNKADLLRLEDSYDREGTPYKHEANGSLDVEDLHQYTSIANCWIQIKDINYLSSMTSDFVFAIISGGFVSEEGVDRCWSWRYHRQPDL